ncbi:MAG: ArsR family transcriptional regulator [Candidatus Bathyarchaeia archaeon]
MSKLWAVQPLHTSIVEVLLKKRGSSTDTDLLNSLKKSYGELSLRELNKTLMRLEIDGIIHVSTLTKNKKRVEIRKI